MVMKAMDEFLNLELHLAMECLKNAGRQRYWQQAMAESQRLGDEFLELVDNDRLGERLQAL